MGDIKVEGRRQKKQELEIFFKKASDITYSRYWANDVGGK
jgi:hypothetical protein